MFGDGNTNKEQGRSLLLVLVRRTSGELCTPIHTAFRQTTILHSPLASSPTSPLQYGSAPSKDVMTLIFFPDDNIDMLKDIDILSV